MSDKLNLVYESSVSRLTEINSSFDKGVLRVAYTGKNRNKSYISKETFENCIETIYNCPVVCNYDRETNSIGAHDVEIVSSDKGMRLVNITQPVGVIPESAAWWWETMSDDSGEEHEYLCVDVIIWKRQEAYDKIKENVITDESMEITVKDGETVDGYYHINSFEFTAFCLLESAEPCFEGARLEMFSLESLKEMCSDMMNDYKSLTAEQSFRHNNDVNSEDENSSSEDCINTPRDGEHNLSKGGNDTLDNNELTAVSNNQETGMHSDINAYTNAYTTNSVLQTLANTESNATFAQTALISEELRRALSEQTYEDPYWGTCQKYLMYDFDSEVGEVYCWDCEEDRKLYGFKYTMNGDNVVVDFDSKKRKKLSVVDFDEGTPDPDLSAVFAYFGKKAEQRKDAEIANVNSEWEKKYSESTDAAAALELEVNELREYRKVKMDEERKEAEEALFSRFEDLNGVEAFEQLKESCAEMTVEEIENKCFEIRGRNTAVSAQAFSLNKTSKPTRITVEKNNDGDEPYGGLFKQYPPKNN